MRCNRLLALVVLITFLTTIPLLPGTQPVAEASASASWPSLWSQYPVISNGQVTGIFDPKGDESPKLIDFTSGASGTQPSVQVASMKDTSGNFLFVRFRMADAPGRSISNLDANFVALAEVGVNSAHRLTVGVDGGSSTIYAIKPDGTGNQPLPAVSYVQFSPVPEGGGEYFVDVRFPLTLIQAVDPSITETTALQFLFGTSTQTNNINKDFTVGKGCWSCVLPITFGPAQLSLTTSATSAAAPVVGVASDHSISYTVRNTGMNTASNVQVTDQLPANVSVKGTPPTGVSVTGQTVVWSAGSMGVGGSATLTLPLVLTPATGEWGTTVPLDTGATATGYDSAASVSLTASANPLTVGPVRNPVPTLTAISPSNQTLGAGEFAMTLSGSNFLPSSEVRINGTPTAVTYVSTTQLQALVPATVSNTAGNYAVTVYNPDNSQALGGGISAAQTLSVALAPLGLAVSDSQVYVQESATLTATGGAGGYTYAFVTNNSGGTISATTYTAGAKGGVTDTLKVTSGGQEATAQIQVLKRPTSVQVTCDPATVAVGGTVTCTVTVTDTTGSNIPVTGEVTVKVGDTIVGTCTLGAPCQVTYTPTAAGTPTITATYNGSDSHAGGTGSQQVTVQAGLSLNLPKSELYVQESITLGASGGTGTYSYTIATTNSGGIVEGTTYTAGSVGGVTDTVKVTSGSQEATAQIQVLKRPTEVAMTCDPAAVAVGGTVTCTVTVTDTTGSNIPVTGEVTVKVGDTTVGTCTLGAPCQVTYTPDTAGTPTITATYNGSDSHAGVTGSQQLTVHGGLSLNLPKSELYVQESITLGASGGIGTYSYTILTTNSGGTVEGTTYTAGSVGGVTDTVKVTSGAQEATAQIQVLKRPTSVQVTCDPATVAVDQTVTCTVTVTENTANPIAMTGTITVTANGETVGTCTPGAPCQVTYTPAAAGTPTITATYSGSDAHAGASGSQQVTVQAGLSLDLPKSELYVQESITLGASGGAGGYTYALVTNNSGATVTGTTYTAGATGGVTDTVKVTSGAQEATAQIQVLKRPTSVQVTCNPATVAVDQTVTCTVTVTENTANPIAMTGTITVTANGETVGTCSLGAPCQVTYTPTEAGTPTITATYSGSDAHAGGSGSQSISVGSGVIAGTVTTDFGTAAVGVSLDLVSQGQTTAQTTSAAGGAYSFSGLLPGTYSVRAVSGSTTLVEGTTTLPEGGNQTVNLIIPTTADLTLTANPALIVGDGSSTSQLQATLKLQDGTVVPNVTVAFATTAGTLSAASGVTGTDGTVSTTLTAPLIESATRVQEQASVVVQDVVRGLFARATIDITFLPPIIEGVVMDNGSPRQPVVGAEVTVRRVVNGEMVFEATTLTDATGHYSVTIPKGNVAYEVLIKVPAQVNGSTVYITSTQTVEIGALSGQGEEIPAPKTINGILVPPAGIPGGWAGLNAGLGLTGQLRDTDGNALPHAVTLRDDGTFQVDNVPVGTYDVVFQKEVNGQRLVGAKMRITVATDGELSIASALVDPFGIVTDKDTGSPLAGVYLELRYADTDELVTLPILAGFAPNQNQVPWTTLAAGDYAWMVYPNRAYYITAAKSGYKPFNSKDHTDKDRVIGDSRIENGIIYVGETIVEYDIQMEKLPVAPPPPPVQPEAPQPQPMPTTTTIRGAVVDTATGRPVAGARVAIPELNLEGTTAADGTYQFTVPQRDRSYTVQVSATVQLQGKPRQLTTTQITAVPASQATTLAAAARRKIAGQLFFAGLTGEEPAPLTAQQAATIRATLERTDSTTVSVPVTVSDDGRYAADDLPAGSYRILFRAQGTDGRLLAVTTVTVQLTQEGQLGMQATLVAPVGTVTDATTGTPIKDVLVSLFWADSPENRSTGRTPGTLVTLPSAPAFFGHNNANPHTTNDLGLYGWLCLPQGDTYVIAKKDGYLPYDSRSNGPSVCGANISLQPMPRQELPEYRRYIRGYPDGTFRPQNQITRAEVATIFARILGANLDTVKPAAFTDLPASHWASRHIAVVVERGLMKGYPEGTFQPDKPITRAELATVIVRFKGLPMGSRSVFQDTAGHWAEPSISAAFEAGIVLGFTDSTFAPSKTTTRAELVAMVNRMLGWSQLITGRTEPRWPDVPFSHWAARHVEKASISHKAKQEADQFDHLVEELLDTIQ